jgi:hypothetical protein
MFLLLAIGVASVRCTALGGSTELCILPGEGGVAIGQDAGDGAIAFDAATQEDAKSDAPSSVHPYVTAVTDDHPVLYYRLEEHSGTVATDSSGGKHDGIVQGEVVLGTPGAFEGSSAASFGGDAGASKGQIYVGDFFDFAEKAPFTLEALYRPLFEDATERFLFFKNDNSGYTVSMLSGRLTAKRLWPYAGAVATGLGASPGRWTHLAITFDGTVLRLYKDGVLLATDPTNGASSATNRALTIGSSDGVSNLFAGDLDELAIYDRALPEDRVRAHSLTLW